MFIKYCFSIANYEIVHGEEKAKNYAANNVKKSGPDYTATSPRENPNTDWRTQNRLNAQREAGAGKSGKDSVDDIVKWVENGDILLSNNIQKGNYGEMNMDVYFKSQGYERISLDRVTDLNAPTHQGIDGVYYNLDGHPPYIIGEAKYGSSRLAILADGTPQMSDKWIIDRLENAVGEGVANDIKMEMILKWK